MKRGSCCQYGYEPFSFNSGCCDLKYAEIKACYQHSYNEAFKEFPKCFLKHFALTCTLKCSLLESHWAHWAQGHCWGLGLKKQRLIKTCLWQMNQIASIIVCPLLLKCHPSCTRQTPLDYDQLKLSWNQFFMSPKWMWSYFRPSGLLRKKRIICFLQKRCRKPPTARSLVWSLLQKMSICVWKWDENSFTQPILLFLQELKLLSISVLWGIWTSTTENVFVYFYLTFLLPTKSKRRLNVTIRTVMQVRVQCCRV